MPERTKTIKVFEFFYAAADRFLSQDFRIDTEAGDRVEDGPGGILFIFGNGNGRQVCVPNTWLWSEVSTQQVKVRD